LLLKKDRNNYATLNVVMGMKFFAKKQLIALLATTIGSSVVILDGTIVNMALPKIASEMHVGFASLQWITDAYLLSLSALILLGGSLGDIFGRKKVYLIGLVGFGVSSLLCAVVPTVELLIAARVLQGVFGALLVPGALAIINTTFTSEGRSQAIGRWTAWSSIAVVLAPFLGGWILGIASWRWIFLINIPLIVICFVLASVSVRETKDARPRKVDAFGALLVSLGLAGITYGLIEGPPRQWPVSAIAVLFLGVALSGAFALYEWRSRDPMVQLSLFKSRNFTGSNLMTFLMYGALSGFTFALVIYLQTHMHYSALQAGLSLLPISILLMLFAGKVGRLSAQYGPRFFMTTGPILAGFGMTLLFFLQPGDSYIIGVLPGVILFSIGLTLLVAPLTTTVMSSVSETSSGIASGINNAVSRVAGLIVIALLGLLGAAQVYQFSMALCAVLALLGGVISFIMIERPTISREDAR
jgi:EmrB/QacA subfamily drug resistance transporter